MLYYTETYNVQHSYPGREEETLLIHPKNPPIPLHAVNYLYISNTAELRPSKKVPNVKQRWCLVGVGVGGGGSYPYKHEGQSFTKQVVSKEGWTPIRVVFHQALNPKPGNTGNKFSCKIPNSFSLREASCNQVR